MPDISAQASLVPIGRIAQTLLIVRGQKVLLDSDLAGLYQVEIKNLNKAVKRNLARFPANFMFQLTREELESSRFQTGTSKTARGEHRKYLPFAFTEHGVAEELDGLKRLPPPRSRPIGFTANLKENS